MDGTFWIDIEDSSGDQVGSGPITTAEGWHWSPRLDEAGTFRFRVPASDPAAAHLVEKRVVRCYAMMDGVKTSLGAGIIDEVALDVGDPSMLEVSGPDLLAELSQVSVKQLRICEQAWTFLNDGRGSVHWLQTDAAGAQTDTDLQDTYDGDLYGPTDSIFLSHDAYPNIRYLYVGHDARFDRVRITMGTNVNDRETVLEGQYFDGSGWRDLSDLTDGTSGYIDWADHWATLNHSGEITFTRPTDWARCTPTTAAGNWFWVRFTVGEGTRTKEDPKQQIQEVEVYADVPTTNGVNLIMQYAPPGWATSGYPATEAAHYIEFDGESILAALRVLVEHGGQDGSGNPIREHFRLGSGRTLTWLGTTLTDTGLRAVDADGIAAEGADEMCLIQHLSRKRDASGVVTRLYPFTADGIDLLLTTRSAPAGYTLVKGAPIPGQPWATASYLQRSSTLGVIEGWARFQDVGMQQGDSYLVHLEMAANALFDRALEYLRTHGEPQEFYDLTIAQVPIIILPGSTIDVVYHEYVDGYHAVDIDTVADGEPLVILATTLEVDNSGAVTTALEVATIDRHAASDASVIAGSIRELRRIQGTTGGLSSHTTIYREASGTAAITGGFINGVTIDNSPIGQLTPSAGAFTAIAVTNNIAVGGTVDGVDISAHAANDSAHHSPVTVGNTGLSIAGQQVSLNLAAVSGLEVDGGLKLADSVAGAGLGIANKVLSVGAGDGISVGADTVAVRLASPAGLSFSGGALQLDDTVAGAGLAINAKVLGIDLATNSGLELSGSPAKLLLRTPSSVSATSTNTVTDVLGHTHKVTTGSARGLSASTVNAEGTGAALARADHGHAITAYSDLATYPAHLAKADALGDSTWHRIDLTDRLRAPLIDTATGQGLTIAPDEDLSLSPVSGVVKATSGVAVGTDNYVSQMTGWRAAYDGGADFRYLYADELHAKSFITDLEQALAGGQIIAKSVAVVAQDFTVPDYGIGVNLFVEDLPGAAGQNVFESGDVVRLRQFTRTSGSLSIADCWGTVIAPMGMGDGTQRWTFIRSTSPQGGTALAGSTVAKGTLALDYGVSGNGFYEVNAIDGAWAQNSPYAQVVTWATHPQSGQVVRSRWGNLRGIFAQADDFGLYAAVAGHTDADQYLRISSLGAVLHNLPLELYSAGDKVLALNPTGPSLALGNPIPSGWLTQTGLWAGNDGGTYKHYVGQVSGGALVKGASWDGQSYNVVGNLIVGPGVGYVVDSALLHLPFDGPLPYETDFHVDLSGHLGQKPTVASGGIIGRPGKFGKAVQLAEATTNLVTNPSFETDASYWWSAWGDTLAASTEQAKFGAQSLKVTGDGATAGIGTYRDTAVTPGTTYTASAWVYVSSVGWPSGTNDPTLRLYDGAGFGTLLASSAGITERDQWVWRSVTATPAQATARVLVFQNTDVAGRVFYVDGVQLEAKAYPTPYCDGSLGPGHAWTGTAHASTSTRAVPRLDYAGNVIVPPTQFSLSVFFYTEHQSTYNATSNGRGLISLGNNTNGLLVYLNPGSHPNQLVGRWVSGGAISYPTLSDTTLTAGVWHHLVATYDGVTLRSYVDGELVREMARPTWAVPTTVLLLGRTPGLAANPPAGIRLDDLLILDRALTADEVRQLYTSGRPVTVTGSPHSLLLTGPGRGKVEGHAGGIFGWDGAAQPMWGFCTEDGVSFGGVTLNAGDFMIGDPAGGNYLQWDASAGTLTVRGDVAVTGSVSVAWSEITNKPDGAVRLTTGTPASAGLWLTGAYMGYYDGSAWRTRISNDGDFLFSKSGGASLLWDASAGKLQGRDASSNVQWETDATTGAIMAGTGKTSLSANGLSFYSTGSYESVSSAKWISGVGSVFARVYGTQGALQNILTLIADAVDSRSPVVTVGTINQYLQCDNYTRRVFVNCLDGFTLRNTGGYGLLTVDDETTRCSVYLNGGLNVGFGTTGAGPGSISASGGLNLGTATGAGAGTINSTGSANVLQWILKNARATDPALVQFGVLDSADKGVYMGRRDANDATYTNYGAAGDAFVYTGVSGRGLNIIVPDATNGILRFFVGTTAAPLSTARMTLLRSGRVLIGTTSDDGVNLLQVNGSVKAIYGEMNWLQILDGIAAPATVAGLARIYVDSADGDLKIKFGNGTVKTIVTD